MARRNLAKTIIEGARYKGQRNEEHATDVSGRRRAKTLLHRIILDPDLADSADFGEPTPALWGTEFRDRLRPLQRWLVSQVGRPWDLIYSDAVKRFNPDSLPGRHLMGHLRGYVTLYGKVQPRYYRLRFPGELYTNEYGILCREPCIDKKEYYRRRR